MRRCVCAWCICIHMHTVCTCAAPARHIRHEGRILEICTNSFCFWRKYQIRNWSEKFRRRYAIRYGSGGSELSGGDRMPHTDTYKWIHAIGEPPIHYKVRNSNASQLVPGIEWRRGANAIWSSWNAATWPHSMFSIHYPVDCKLFRRSNRHSSPECDNRKFTDKQFLSASIRCCCVARRCLLCIASRTMPTDIDPK